LRADQYSLAYDVLSRPSATIKIGGTAESTIHKSQESEFQAVVIPLATQHYILLQRNLIYTGITRGKPLLVLIGQRTALSIAVRNDRSTASSRAGKTANTGGNGGTNSR
jgi:hypothetical protein